MRMVRRGWIVFVLAIGVLSGCATAPDSEGKDESTEEGSIRDIIRFPEYFLIEGIDLGAHGRIPSSRLIGAEMTSSLELGEVRSLFNDQLAAHGWTTDKMEIGRGYFRAVATLGQAWVEIRGVQGSGITEVFLLYLPVGQ